VERVLFAPRVLPALRPDVQQDPGPYSDWVTQRETARVSRAPRRTGTPTLCVVMVVEREPPPETVLTLRSLQVQSDPNWILRVALAELHRPKFATLLLASGTHPGRPKVEIFALPGPSVGSQIVDVAVNGGAETDVALIFPGDVWAPDAVSRMASELTPTDVVYADEDRTDAHGSVSSPRLKPDYSPEFLLHSSYIGRPIAVGSTVARRMASLGPLDPANFEHDFALRACESAERTVHIPEVLCHTTLDPGHDPAHTDQVVDALARRKETGHVDPGAHPGTFELRRAVPRDILVSIIVPFRDEPQFLRTCIETIEATKGSLPVEYLLVDNGSVLPETATLTDHLSDRTDTRLIADDRPFNWAGLNNSAVELARGNVLLFLNNDIEALRPGWLDALCAQAVRPGVGAVGARLLYPDRRLQHCGVVIGMGGAAGHVLVGLQPDEPGYLNMAVTARECTAVTGACLATRRVVFEELRGFDDSLGIDLNDIDYCLRARQTGLSVIYEPGAELVHHESPSRGVAGDVSDIVRFVDRWRPSIVDGDPYLNPQLTRVDPSCALRALNEDAWWQQWAAGLVHV
jgi:GT2 family glycosyltransferase